MHRLYKHADALTYDVISAAIEVHQDRGPGLLESIYEWSLTKELELRGHQVLRQDLITIRYKQFEKKEILRFDLLVNCCLLVESKAVEQLTRLHKAQLLSYMKLLDIPVGLIFNFHSEKLTDSMARLILPGAASGVACAT